MDENPTLDQKPTKVERLTSVATTFKRVVAVIALALTVFFYFHSRQGIGALKKGVAAFEKKDYTTALTEFQSAADVEDTKASAEFNLGMIYRDGLGVPKDHARAIQYFTQADKDGAADADLTLARYYDDPANGIGDQNEAHKAAVGWYQVAAKRGSPEGQGHLAYKYLKGVGIGHDDKQAYEWYRKAALQGDAGSQYVLGLLLNEGVGAPADPVESYSWIALAAQQGNADATHDRDELRKNLKPDQIARGQEMADKFKPKAEKGS